MPRKSRRDRQGSQARVEAFDSEPMARLCQAVMAPERALLISESGSLYMSALSEQFAAALADENLEAALAMLSGCPALAKMPCSKSLVSALHYSCASVRLAPATRALLLLGCDPLGNPRSPGQSPDGAGSPMRWAASSGNLPAVEALILAGAKPALGDLHEACRQAKGACASAILTANPLLDPFAPVAPFGTSSHQALSSALSEISDSVAFDAFGEVRKALAAFERWALAKTTPGPSPSAACEESSAKRL